MLISRFAFVSSTLQHSGDTSDYDDLPYAWASTIHARWYSLAASTLAAAFTTGMLPTHSIMLERSQASGHYPISVSLLGALFDEHGHVCKHGPLYRL